MLLGACIAFAALGAALVAPIGYANAVDSACSEIAASNGAELWGHEWRGFRQGNVCTLANGNGRTFAERRIGLVP
jgi:hypothetical protein